MPHGPANKVGYIVLLEVLSWLKLALSASRMHCSKSEHDAGLFLSGTMQINIALHKSDINKCTNIVTPRSVPSPFFHGSIKFSPHQGANLSTPDKHKDSLSPQISSLQIALPAPLRIRGEITTNIWKCSLYLKSVIKEMRCVRKCKV